MSVRLQLLVQAIRDFFFKPKKVREKTELRYYECKLCGEIIEPIYVNTVWGYDVVISAKTLARKHLLEKHGVSSFKKKYIRKYSFYNPAKSRIRK